MALQYRASAKLCGIEQRVPPIFGRAAITLGIGPHFYLMINFIITVQYGDSAGNGVQEISSVFCLIRVLVTISKGIRHVKPCCDKIVQFLTVGTG